MALIGTVSAPLVTGNLTIGSGGLSYDSVLKTTKIDNLPAQPGGWYVTAIQSETTLLNNSTSGFKNLKSFSFPDNFNAANAKVISVGFTGYISAGSYYWTWRVYNAREGAALPVIRGNNSGINYGSNDIAAGGGIAYLGNVHAYSAQPYVAFDASSCQSGDTIYIQMCGHNTGGGGVGGLRSDSAQTLYMKNLKVFAGIAIGFSGTEYFGT